VLAADSSIAAGSFLIEQLEQLRRLAILPDKSSLQRVTLPEMTTSSGFLSAWLPASSAAARLYDNPRATALRKHVFLAEISSNEQPA
jgi:hypothetical protein